MRWGSIDRRSEALITSVQHSSSVFVGDDSERKSLQFHAAFCRDQQLISFSNFPNANEFIMFIYLPTLELVVASAIVILNETLMC